MRIRFRDESGGVGLVVTAVVAATLLVSSLAIVVDGGSVYLERRTVTNAAQAAALALARECVEKPTSCANSTIPSQFANLNSPDGLTEITEICINGTRVGGGPCQTLTSNKLDCSPASTTTGNYVRIRTESKSADAAVGIRIFFTDQSDNRVVACAQARWGNASSAAVYAPFAVSICEWAKQSALPRTLVEYKTNSGVSSCTWTFADLTNQTFTRSGISGWAALDLLSPLLPSGAAASVSCPSASSDRPAYLRIGYQLGQIQRSPSSPIFCGDSNLAAKMTLWLNQTLYIPLVSTEQLTGNATIHTVEAFAAFKLLGYTLQKGSGNATESGGTPPPADECDKNLNCLYGEFIATVSSDSDFTSNPSVPNVGLQSVRLF